MNLKFLFLGIVIPFLATFGLTMWIHPLMVKLAKKRDFVDNPDARKLQKEPVPLLGGIAVFWGIVIGVGITSVLFNSYIFYPMFVAVTVMMYLGTLDDLMGLSPRFRIVVEILIMLFIIFSDGCYINNFHGAFGIYELNPYFAVTLSVVAGVGIMNAINMIDGVDGLSSGFCFFAYLCFGYGFLTSGDGGMTVISIISIGALIPFFLHNVFGRTSKMFIGDSGSLMQGTILTICVFHVLCVNSKVAYNYPNMGAVAFTLSVLSVPVFDTLRVMITRIIKGKSPFSPDKSHLHHLFIEIGFSHICTSIFVILLNFICVIVWLTCYQLKASITLQLVTSAIMGVIVTFGFYYTIRKMNHNRLPYRLLVWVAQHSHIERGRKFHKIQNLLDNI